jgi:hypothetical protein
VHPNAGSSTAAESRRTQQATQFRRRLNAEEVAEARAVLEQFQLEEWGAPDGAGETASQVDLSTPA